MCNCYIAIKDDKFCVNYFNCPCVYLYIPTLRSEGHELHEFAICTSWKGFPDLNPNCYTIKNIKLDLIVSNKVKFK